MQKITIFDTTLRDGEQSPGASLNIKEKLEIARQLARLGVDVIEAGFPAASEGDFESVKLIAQKIKGPAICGLARAIQKDIEICYNALRYSKNPRIHIFLATSKIHLKYKLKKAEDEVLKQAVSSVRFAKRFVKDVQFSPEDATRTEKGFLFEILEAVIKAGATVVNIPDTVGYTTPQEYRRLMEEIKDNVPSIEKAVISCHCHDDLGMAAANSLAAVYGGAQQVECTVNGIGERAGSAPLEEIVMALKVRRDFFGKAVAINTKELDRASKLVSKLTGIYVQSNKAIIGRNAFSHESGVHQDGILKQRRTYEIMKPADVGVVESRLVLGKHSGSHAFKDKLKKLDFKLTSGEMEKAFAEFKNLADKKKEIFDEDIRAIIEDEIITIKQIYRLKDFEIKSGSKTAPFADIRLSVKGKVSEASSGGDGPVDACYKAIDKITKKKGRILDYSIRSVTGGREAIGEVSIKVKFGKETVSGRGISTDIIEASIKAYLNAVNKAIAS